MPQINTIPNPVTLDWHWANQPCSKSQMVNADQGSTMSQINTIPNPVTLDWHWANQPCSKSQMVNADQGSNRCQFFSIWS